MSFIPQLVAIYAAHKVDDINKQPELREVPFGKSLQELSAADTFPADEDLVRDLKLSVEADAANYATADKKLQISECLKALLRLSVYDESPPTTVALRIKTLQALLAAMYAHGWSQPQKDHFNFVASCLGMWHAYFLSYTNSGATVVNDDYKAVIRKHADPVIRKARDPDKDNMLPDAIVNWLDRHKGGRRSFYDKKAIEAGDFLKEAIAPAVRNGMVFIQLVHLDTFTSKQKVNWSFEEYRVFMEYNDEVSKNQKDYRIVFESRLIPVIAGDPIKLNLPDEKLKTGDNKVFEARKQWRDRLFAAPHYLTLPTDKAKFEGVMQTLEEAIMRRAYRIIESVPS